MGIYRDGASSESQRVTSHLYSWLHATRQQIDAAAFARQIFAFQSVEPRLVFDEHGEQPAHLSATLLSTLLDRIRDGALLFTRAGEIVWANRAAAERFGRSLSEISGARLEQWLGASTSALLLQTLNAPAAQTLPNQLLLPGRTRQLKLVDVHITYLGPKEFGLCGLMLYDRRDREHYRRLQETEQRFAVALKNSSIIVSHCDCDRRYTWVYHPADPLAASYWLGRRDEEIMPLEDVAELVELKEHVLNTGIGERREVRTRGADGVRFFDVTAEPLRDAAGQMIGLTVTRINITDRKQVEQQLTDLSATLEHQIRIRTAEAEQRTKQLRTLAAELTYAEQRERKHLAQMLHDHLQQLVVAAKMGVGRLRRQANYQELNRALLQIEELLNETIQVSRSLVVELSPPILHIAGLSEALLWLARSFGEKYGLLVEVESDDSIEPEAEDVKIFLFQAVRELLFNVVKHGQTDRATLALACSADHEQLEITVEDFGQGFKLQHAELDTQEPKFGLFSVRERLETLGGTLTIDSAPGQGTRARLLAPLRAARLGTAPVGTTKTPSVNQLKASEPPPRQSGKIRVLLVDDHKIMRQGLVSLLAEQADLEVIGEAADGREAIEQTHALQPDVVIMDINMPRLNGIEATRQIKRHFPLTVVIGLSLHEEAQMAATMRRAGADAYVSKEHQLGDLCRTIRAACAPQKLIQHS